MTSPESNGRWSVLFEWSFNCVHLASADTLSLVTRNVSAVTRTDTLSLVTRNVSPVTRNERQTTRKLGDLSRNIA